MMRRFGFLEDSLSAEIRFGTIAALAAAVIEVLTKVRRFILVLVYWSLLISIGINEGKKSATSIAVNEFE